MQDDNMVLYSAAISAAARKTNAYVAEIRYTCFHLEIHLVVVLSSVLSVLTARAQERRTGVPVHSQQSR